MVLFDVSFDGVLFAAIYGPNRLYIVSNQIFWIWKFMLSKPC